MRVGRCEEGVVQMWGAEDGEIKRVERERSGVCVCGGGGGG